MVRVVGTDPGTSSLDLVLLVDGAVCDQARLGPETLRQDPDALVAVLSRWSPLDLIAGPSGYGLPLVPAARMTERDLDEMSLVRPEERGTGVGVLGFRSWVRSLVRSGLPVVFLPGGIHLPTIPVHRKLNAIDMGTADKVAVAALALWEHRRAQGGLYSEATFAVAEIGSAFTALLVVERGRLVDAAAGTRGPIGIRSGGCWDGETAYWRGPLSKDDLFRGGLGDLGETGLDAFRESLAKHVAGLKAVTNFDPIYLSATAGYPGAVAIASEVLSRFGPVRPLQGLPGASVKPAAQGAALLADGLAGGGHADLVASLELHKAAGTVLDHLRPPGRALAER